MTGKRNQIIKLKPSRQDEDETDGSLHFENLPDVILFKIFSYLYIGDLCRAGRVCLRWYNLTRCQVLWKYVDAHDMQLTSYQLQKMVPILPPCVTYLRISSLSTQQRIPFLTPQTAIEIRERCPHLRTLIIESAFVAKHINFTDITVEDLPQKLSVLSLRKSFFHTDQFFCSVSHPTVPKIKVLDCTSCWCVCDNDIPFFSRLGDLQEIYLAGCPISDVGVVILLKAVEHLKVLDLEATKIGGQTILSLSQNSNSLEKLYLGYTDVADEHFRCLQNTSLPMLQIVCLRKTSITCVGLRYLLNYLRSLKYMNVSNCSISSECALELSLQGAPTKQLNFESNKIVNLEYCDHFFHRNNFRDY
ncbi:F-box/LRR-repeat protein 12 isoform X2 [Parasteatoda tepidariorum]|uniref:F-box/LRR-repeat protein 12 isoform X2 n=1 Tax=Parasteatoda tepidariorum TaxID=114398 RepID=UPI001C71846E|nr:F-box/LRR-repeat protein 12 isoform X2 [Parasteatoda tepidariorum]